jgi:hypothetical protein
MFVIFRENHTLKTQKNKFNNVSGNIYRWRQISPKIEKKLKRILKRKSKSLELKECKYLLVRKLKCKMIFKAWKNVMKK